jgi:hypothetical protein
VRGIDTSKWKREGPHHYRFPGGATNLVACPLKPRERRDSVFHSWKQSTVSDRFPTIMGPCAFEIIGREYIYKERKKRHLYETDMEDGAVVRVGALVENPAVQQHVFRLVDGQVDGIAGHGRGLLIAAEEMMRSVSRVVTGDDPPQGKPFEVPLERLAEGGVVDGLLVAEVDEAVVDLLLDVVEAAAAIRSSRGGGGGGPVRRPGALADSLLEAAVVVLHLRRRGAAYGASIATCSASRDEGAEGDEVEREGDGDGETGGGIRGGVLAESRSLVFIEGWTERAVGA